MIIFVTTTTAIVAGAIAAAVVSTVAHVADNIAKACNKSKKSD